ncbi:HxlR family transcriptional regulator [Sphaerisporangium siamense]|uniref:DNA-binding HxlR family transcriptional regulator n=1 Tax=Sphaerisporangium siamense TaxID=795645 RepID=A0A7W7GC43_9ACTN|nr:helix-turn-helix domain-containing protein [Sphaerisporangium siamense]MBB4704167.1 DNA-binding HxlR family transcriptional regulator [Sphaerisporangium siamense]GII85152.1 HxlR family transcriptional regulator [Sphaerisporangium siamense]
MEKQGTKARRARASHTRAGREPVVADGRDACARDEHDEVVFDVFARGCPSRETMEHITGRWGILALAALADGTYRFNALRRRVDGVSEKMLAQTLQALERDGMVHRAAQPTIPPKVEYSLTPLGREAARRLSGLIEWLEGEMPEVMTSRAHYDTERNTPPTT